VSEPRSGEHQELVERFEAQVSERFAAYGAPTAEYIQKTLHRKLARLRGGLDAGKDQPGMPQDQDPCVDPWAKG
jgi:hypothetical protein